MRTILHAGLCTAVLLAFQTPFATAQTPSGPTRSPYTGGDLNHALSQARTSQYAENCERFKINIRTIEVMFRDFPPMNAAQPNIRAIHAEFVKLRREGCPRKKPEVAATPPAQPVTERSAPRFFNWSGFYAGVNVGLGAGQNDFVNVAGGSLGVQAGYMIPVSTAFLLGVQIGLIYDSVHGSRTDGGVTEQHKQQWSAKFLALAAIVNNGILFYATAGPVLANVEFSISGVGFIDRETQVIPGLAAGLGARFPITQFMSIEALYLFTRLASKGFFDGTVNPGETTVHSARVGINFHFGPQ